MNCIFCHQALIPEDFNKYQYKCNTCSLQNYCKVLFFWNKDGSAYSVILDKYIDKSYRIVLFPGFGYTNYFIGENFAVQFPRLYWVFPQTLTSYITKFNKLIPLL